jgi:hypothetical protein
MDWNHTWQKCSLQGPYQVLLLFVPIGHPTWQPGAIKASDLSKFQSFQFHPPVVSEKKIFKNFSQSEAIMSPGSHIGRLIGTKVTPLGQTIKGTFLPSLVLFCL